MSTTSRWDRLTDIPESRWPRVPPSVSVLVAVASLLFSAWNWYTLSDAYQELHGAANLAHPSVVDCAIAGVIVADIHGSGRDRQVLRMFGDARLGLETSAWAWDKPAGLAAGYRVAGGDGDWRWCPGLGRYVRSIGWVRLSDVLRQRSAINISTPAYNAAHDEAVAFVDAMPDPRSPGGWDGRDRLSAIKGELVFLKQDQRSGAWAIVGREPAN